MTPPKTSARTSSVLFQEGYNSSESVKRHKAAIQSFLDELDSIESTKPMDSMPLLLSAASLLVEVKSSQREIFKSLDVATQERDCKRAELDRKKLLLQNLLYERNHLMAELSDLKCFHTPHLERMCNDELLHEASDSTTTTVNLFLCGRKEESIHDRKNHKTIMTKLHKELNSRGSLQRELEKLQSSLHQRKLEAEKEESFLRDIPKKLEMIEKCSIPLQEFFHSAGTDNSLKLIGTERKKRLDLAKFLSGPLYALFIQFQTYLDNQHGPHESALLQVVHSPADRTKSEEIAPHPHLVHLSFVIPDIHMKEASSGKKKRVTIEFAFFQELSIVTARVFGGGDKINRKFLLTNLFPGDVGNWNGSPDHPPQLSGKPYHWCNFIAGLIMPSVNGHVVNLSTKAVVRAIENRIRANATLTQLLSSFERNKKPFAHHLFKDKLNVSDCSAKLTSWTMVNEIEASSQETVQYVAVIKNGSRTLSARVVVNWSRYPAVRPSWSLCEGQEAWPTNHGSVSKLQEETNPLYSNALGQMESIINEELVYADHDSSSFDWILSHQLIKLVCLWDVGEAGLGHESSAKGTSRVIKGRNRVSIN